MKKKNAERLIEAGLIKSEDLNEQAIEALERLSEAEINAVVSGGKKLLSANPQQAGLRVVF